MSVYGISFKNNPEQQELIRLIQDNSKRIIIVEGAAGTGKSFATIACALEMQKDKKYKNIIYTRNVVQVGESIGFLKGSVEDKVNPFMASLGDALHSICRLNKSFHCNENELFNHFEIEPITFMRGRTIDDDTICIVDECQNCSLVELQTLLTRISEYGKIVLLGSIKQIDDPKQSRKEKCDFQRVYELLQSFSYVGFIHFTQSMRSSWCKEVDEALESLKKDNHKKAITAT